jgi:hypothetical protein
MCAPVDPMTAFAVATTAVNAVGGAQDARRNASAAEASATNEARAAAERAQRLWAQGQKVLADQRMDFLASPGVEAGSGSALEVGAADAAALHTDVLTELFGGQSRALALRKEAKDMRASARLQLGTAFGAAATLAAPSIWGALSGKTTNVGAGLATRGGPRASGLGRLAGG